MNLTREQLDEMIAKNPSLAKRNFDLTIMLGDKAAIKQMAVDNVNAIRKELLQPAKAIIDSMPSMTKHPLNVTKIAQKKKPLLNKTEKAWRAELECRGHKIILAQAITFKLGDRLTYRPDLVTIQPIIFGTDKPKIMMTCWETKAPHRFKTAGMTKIKAAAKQYPYIRFVLVMRDKGQWTEREIGSE